ncbi:hypothetical protein PAAG_08822 [Paracoccidioides lutzii Pb01]|uniref:Uncharacterized protein n=1 Tax=Paracoccidioides lutzii (strain ATCC MYA-826 / Pb01) TaxID=502779 RepID=C1HDI1_PARBA|nr:hypothetical protein PAAG_08822 [Paracoccidioides lutzii Pb01]EEH39553.2 hypothetical protein PAAG_08822 [Paracoccidioides lutzii Pb01]
MVDNIFRLEIDNHLYHKWWDVPPLGPSQTGWEALGGVFSMGWKLLEQKGGAWEFPTVTQLQLLAAGIDSTFLVSEQTTHLFTNDGGMIQGGMDGKVWGEHSEVDRPLYPVVMEDSIYFVSGRITECTTRDGRWGLFQ